MKFKMILFLTIIFLTSIAIKAQPDCNGKFSPYNICHTDYTKAEFIFYGEVLVSVKNEQSYVINNKAGFVKSQVKVDKIFKGKPTDKLELFLDIDIACLGIPPVGSKHIYIVKKVVEKGEKLYYSENISQPLTDYSSEALNKVFNNIETILKNQRENILEGVVQEYLDKRIQVDVKKEEFDKYFLRPDEWKPLVDILVEVVNEKTGKTFKTQSRSDGTYKIHNIFPGKYKIRAYLSDGRKVEKEIITDGSLCKRQQSLIFY